jgi:hypothetical protein
MLAEHFPQNINSLWRGEAARLPRKRRRALPLALLGRAAEPQARASECFGHQTYSTLCLRLRTECEEPVKRFRVSYEPGTINKEQFVRFFLQEREGSSSTNENASI